MIVDIENSDVMQHFLQQFILRGLHLLSRA